MTLYRRQGSRPSPRERNAKRQKDYLRSITLQIAEKKEKLKAKEKRKGIPEFQRIARRDKKAFLSD